MQLTQRQITFGVFGLVTISSFALLIFYFLRADIVALTASGIGFLCSVTLFWAYWRGFEWARYGAVVVTTAIIPLAMTDIALYDFFHPLVLLPTVLALVLASPRWVIGTALYTYIVLLVRAGGTGIYTNAEVIVGYIVIVAGLVVSRLATDTAQRIAMANERAEHERQRAEAALSVAAHQTEELRQTLGVVAEREHALASALTELQASQHTIRNLSAPMLPILPGVLVAPLIGALDTERIALFSTNLLRAIEQQRVRHVIFDITGVSVVDNAVTQALISAAQAARLLGARVSLAGVRPEVAQELVALHISFEAIAPYADLQSAVQALNQDAYRLT